MIVWFEETERWGSGRLEYIGKVFRLMVRENSTSGFGETVFLQTWL